VTLTTPQRAVLANPIKLAKDENQLCLALEQSKVNWKSSVQIQVTAGRELPAGRDSKFVLVGVYRVGVCRCALDCPEGIRRQLVSEATAQRPSFSLESVGHGAWFVAW